MTSTPVYVISRIRKLAECILKRATSFVHEDVKVFDVTVPENSDYLDEKAVKDLEKAKIVVIDPILLAANHNKMSALEWAHSTWAGVEGLFTCMEKPNFILTKHAGEAFANLIAEYVLGQILNYERGFRKLWQHQQQKQWNACLQEHAGRTLDEITISVLGAGNMAQAVARCCKPHGTKVYALARTSSKEKYFSLFDQVTKSLDEILSSCDYLVNTLPHTRSTAGMLNGEVLRSCLKCPVFINVGRGSIINEESLINAIEQNWIAGAILDVFSTEPLPCTSPLWEMDTVSITPHCAAVSRADHVADSFLKALVYYRKGEQLPNVVDWEAGY